MLERLNREIKRRTRAVGAFPDADSALALVGARLRYVTWKKWGPRRYMERRHLWEQERAEAERREELEKEPAAVR